MVSRPLATALLVTAVVTAVRVTRTVDSDVAWQLWIAGRIHAGAILYRDIVEINPPLWFWMALPVDRARHAPPRSSGGGAHHRDGSSVALSLTAADRLLQHSPAGVARSCYVYAALILMAMPWVHIGQREQIVLIGTLPYAALISARHQGRTVRASPCRHDRRRGRERIRAQALLSHSSDDPRVVADGRSRAALARNSSRNARDVAVGVAYGGGHLLFAGDYLTRMLALASRTVDRGFRSA